MLVLLQAIFSDDSDDEEENTTSNQVEDTQKKIEVANTTLNRLIAGDFLESLGKELGLVVPPETPMSEIKGGARVPQKETVNVDKGGGDSPPAEKKRSASQNLVGSSTNGERTENKLDILHKAQEVRRSDVFLNTDTRVDGGKTADRGSIGDGRKESRFANVPGEERDLNTHRTPNRSRSSSSSEDERSRKSSSRHRQRSCRSSTSDSDTSSDSDDYRDRHRSRSRRKERGSSQEKSSSRRRSKHHKNRRKYSPSRSHRSSGKDHESHKRKKSKYED